MKKLLLLFLLCSYFSSFAQLHQGASATALHHKFSGADSNPRLMAAPDRRTCLTAEVNDKLEARYLLPSTKKFEQKFEKLKNEFLTRKKASRTTATVITIPVIVHVVHNGEEVGVGANISSEQVLSQIEVLNEDFRRKSGTSGFNTHIDGADVEIEFAPALRDEFGNTLAEPGIHRVNGNKDSWQLADIQNTLKPQTIWSPEQYMNIWTANFGGDLADILGYAQFPSLSGLDGLQENEGLANTDGVVIGYKYFGRVGNVAAPYNQGRTATHEVGHWLGLIHIWGDGDCSVDDYCEDTPAAAHPNYECTYINSCTDAGEDAADMVENYMDYTNDACMNIFTQDQKARMQTVMSVCPRRKELLSSTVHTSTQLPIAYFQASKTEVCSGDVIEFTDNSVNDPTNWQWKIFDSDSTETGSYSDANPVAAFPETGVYSVLLIVGNSFGADTLFKPNYISVLSGEVAMMPFNEDFENINALENWIFSNPDGDRTWQETDVASAPGGSSAIFIDNYSDIDGDPSGHRDALISPAIDLATPTHANLTFDMAYARYGTGYSDSLVVLISTDCGSNFTPIWSKGDLDLATAPDNQADFIPSADDWATESISLQEYNGFSNVHIAIVNISGWGNNLYLDNISLSQSSSGQPAVAEFNTPQDTVSVGSTINFWDASLNYPTSWAWEFEGAEPATSSEQNPAVTYNTPGIFDVKLTVSNADGGDTKLAVDYMTIIDKPDISIISSAPDNNVCKGDSIVLVASGAGFYEWRDEREYLISENDTLVVFPQINTSYELTGYDKYGGSSKLTEEVFVNPLPDFDLGQDTSIMANQTVILDVGQNFSAYAWNDGSTSAMLAVSGDEYEVGAHEFFVEVTDANNCSSTDTIGVTIMRVTAAEKMTANEIKIYPVPAFDKIFVNLANRKNVTLNLYDLRGKLLMRKLLDADIAELDISRLPQGVYAVKLSGNKINRTIKIIKKN